MQETIAFTVPAIPVAQPRQRHRIAGAPGRQFVQNYTPAKSPTADYKATVKLAAAEAYSGAPLSGPLAVGIVFVFPRRSKPDWIKKDSPWFATWKAGGRVPHITKPDRDNLDKSTLDALKGLLFCDDKQVCAGPPEKWIAAADEQAHVEISVEPLLPAEGAVLAMPPALYATA